MAELLKLVYNQVFIDKLAKSIHSEYANFDYKSFSDSIFDSKWDNLELKERMHHITTQINKHLPFTYQKQIEILNKVVPQFSGYPAMLFPNFIEKYGLDDYQISIKALEYFTQFSTSEFAVRPFIIKYPKQTMGQMLKWSKHTNFHVRRLASEGCRPLLPWATKLHVFVKNPEALISILENLKADKEDYVYRSVANNLNDISKNHPQLVIDLCTKWIKANHKNTNWLIKHALRTLLKKGNQDAMKLFGFGKIEGLKINTFNINDNQIKIGDSSFLNIEVENTSQKAKFRLEYAILYLKNNGKHNPKTFQIKEQELAKGEKISVSKKLNFHNLTTRKHYKGEHFIVLKINGIETKKIDFKLI